MASGRIQIAAWRVVALVLAAAGVLKLVDSGPESSEAMLPRSVLLAVGAIEAALGGALLMRPNTQHLRTSATLLMLAATAVLLYAHTASVPVSACGCFGSLPLRSIGGHFALNGIILILCGIGTYWHGDHLEGAAAGGSPRPPAELKHAGGRQELSTSNTPGRQRPH
jgi:hypothetical protein